MNIDIQNQNQKIQIYVLVIGIILLIIKFLAYFFTHSVLILSDALESIVNLLAAIIGLYSLYFSAIPKDESHPYGHGKIEFLTSGIEGGLIFFAGLTIIYESVQRFFITPILHSLDKGIIFILITGIMNGITGNWVKKIGKRNRNLQLISSGQHLITDAFSTFGVGAGILIVYFTQWLWLDSLLGLIIGIYILFPSYFIIRNSIAGIMDESDKELTLQFINLLKKYKNEAWIDIHNLKILKNGSIIHVDLHLTLPFYWTVQQATYEVKKIEELVKNEFGALAECSIQVDSCSPHFCTFCSLHNCDQRAQPFIKNWNWDYQKITELHT